MNLRDLEYFTTVARTEHFSKAADRCGVSQPALSERIKKLEGELGVSLLERGTRSVKVTETGALIAKAATRVLEEVDILRRTAASARDPFSGSLRIGAFPTISGYIFPRFAMQIKNTFPDLKLIFIEIKTLELLTQLKEGFLDAAILALPVQERDLNAIELFKDPFLLAAPADHPLAKEQCVTPKQIDRFELLLLEEGHCLRTQALDFCHKHGVGERADFRGSGIECLREMVRAGAGLTLMPLSLVRKHDPGITYIPFEEPAPSRTIGLIHRKTSPSIKALQELAKLAPGPNAIETSMEKI